MTEKERPRGHAALEKKNENSKHSNDSTDDGVEEEPATSQATEESCAVPRDGSSRVAEVVPFKAPTGSQPRQHSDSEWLAFVEAVRVSEEANKVALEQRQGSRRWLSTVFEFTRRIRPEPMVEQLSAEEAAEIVEIALREIHGEDEEELIWEVVFGDTDTEGNQIDPYSDFLYCWDKALKHGSTALEQAVQGSRENRRAPMHFGEKFKGQKHKKFRVFLSVLEELQNLKPDEPIFFSAHLLAYLLDTSIHQIRRWRKMAEVYGFLRVVSEPNRRERKATEYSFQIPKEMQTLGTVPPESQSTRNPEHQITRWPDSQKGRSPHPQRNKPSEIHEDDDIQF